MLRRIVIPRHERGFLYRDGNFDRVLRPGVHWILDWRPTEVRRASQLAPELTFPDVELLARLPEVAAEVELYRIEDHEVGLLFREGNFKEFLAPGRYVYLKSPILHEVEIVDTREIEVTHPRREVFMDWPGAELFLQVVDVPDGHQGVVYFENVRTRVLESGRHAFWSTLKAVRYEVLDLREQTLEIQGQELMTLDKVSLRVNLSVRYQITDPTQAVATQASYHAAIYRDLQLALREEVGTRPLEELLTRKEELGVAITERVAPKAEAMGMKLHASGIRDVILPGEMKTILNQVVEAEKRAQANKISRQEETAATRSLANTARLLESNPLLMRLKELESVERIAERIGSLSVIGGVEGLVEALRGVPYAGGGADKKA